MTYYDRAASEYRNRLHPWCIIRLLPQMQRVVIGRFRRRNDAEAHLKALQQLHPEARYAIVFDPPDFDPPDLTEPIDQNPYSPGLLRNNVSRSS